METETGGTQQPELKDCKVEFNSRTQGWTTTTVIKIEMVTVPGPLGRNYRMINQGGHKNLEPRRLSNEGELLCTCSTCVYRRNGLGSNPDMFFHRSSKTDFPPAYKDLFMEPRPPSYNQCSQEIQMDSFI